MLVFVCSPYRGDVVTNLINARNYCKYVIRRGHIPIAPHIYFTQFLNDGIKEQRELGTLLGRKLLKECRELWVFGPGITEGMEQEIEFALKNNIKVSQHWF